MNQAVIDIQGITKTYVNGKLSVPVFAWYRFTGQ